jgi:hypothetical protein
MSDEIAINSELALAEHIRDLRAQWHKEKFLYVTVRKGKQRTLTQSRALHLFCTMLADTLNAAGLDMKKTLKPDAEIPWDGAAVKERLWKPIQEAVIGKLSTTEADRIEYSKVFDVLAHHLATKLGVTCPEWPTKQTNDAASPQRKRA